MDTMLLARTRRKLTTEQLAKMSGINLSVISGIERGVRVPTRKQRIAILDALGPMIFEGEEREDESMHENVPVMPEGRWTDGKPDFSHLEGDGGSVRDQLSTLIAERYENASLKHLTTEHCFFEVLDEDGGSRICKQPYLVTNGKATLKGEAVESEMEFAALSRRRIRRQGVPEPSESMED